MRLLMLGALLAGLSACSGSFDGTYSGSETGTQNGMGFTTTLTVTLSEGDSGLTGTWSSATGSSGTVTGTINGDKIEPFTAVAPSTDSCPGTFTGTLTRDGDKLTGTYGGTSGTCGVISATIDLTKQ